MSSFETNFEIAATVKPCARWSAKAGPAVTDRIYGFPFYIGVNVSKIGIHSSISSRKNSRQGNRTYLLGLVGHLSILSKQLFLVSGGGDLEQCDAVDGFNWRHCDGNSLLFVGSCKLVELVWQ